MMKQTCPPPAVKHLGHCSACGQRQDLGVGEVRDDQLPALQLLLHTIKSAQWSEGVSVRRRCERSVWGTMAWMGDGVGRTGISWCSCSILE
jgi:hypothetical protein